MSSKLWKIGRKGMVSIHNVKSSHSKVIENDKQLKVVYAMNNLGLWYNE